MQYGFGNFYFHPWSQIRLKNDVFFKSLVTWTPWKFQVVEKNDMLGFDWACLVDAQSDFRSYILPSGVKKKILKKYISINWNSLVFLFCY